MIELVIPGKARGKGRPRFNTKTGRTYTDSQTRAAEQLIQSVWMEAGRPYLGDAPLSVTVELVLGRPQTHYRKGGSLSAAGLRSGQPARKPDVDNAFKLIDALNTLAFRDDAQIVTAHIWKRWAACDEVEHTRITIRALTGAVEEEAIAA